jgi:hypothetical protein
MDASKYEVISYGRIARSGFPWNPIQEVLRGELFSTSLKQPQALQSHCKKKYGRWRSGEMTTVAGKTPSAPPESAS